MSKWVTVLVAGFITICLILGSVLTIFSDKPFRAFDFVFLALTVASAWWLVKVIRTPSAQEPQPEPEMSETNTERPTGGWMILGCVLGTFLWAFIWTGVVAPLFELPGLSVKAHFLFIIGIPTISLWIVDKVKAARRKNNAQDSSTAASLAPIEHATTKGKQQINP